MLCTRALDLKNSPGMFAAGGGGAAGKSWLGTLREGLNPPLAEYPLDACSWGVYVRLHGLSGQVRLRLRRLGQHHLTACSSRGSRRR